MTEELLAYTRDLLAYGLTNKLVCEITGLGKNTVKDIDLERLKDKYTIDGKTVIKPERHARCLGIDEFKLHDGHRFATVIIDLDSGHILWLAHGKKKAVVYDFIKHVGLEWMDHVEAIACDMNSDYQEAFEEMCPGLQCVFDYFHIKKNFNDKVQGENKKNEQRRLIAEGNEKIMSENKLLFTCELVLEKLTEAYKLTDEWEMANEIAEIMDICQDTKNKHLIWFSKLLDNHFDGIIAHATYRISSGKVEGINQKIKTVRRQGYGYPDDEYFFLKLFDASRKDYVRNVISPKLSD